MQCRLEKAPQKTPNEAILVHFIEIHNHRRSEHHTNKIIWMNKQNEPNKMIENNNKKNKIQVMNLMRSQIVDFERIGHTSQSVR